MEDVSADFLRTVQAPHTEIARVDVYQDDHLILSLPIHSGVVESDRTGDIRTRFDCKITDENGTLVPKGIRDLLAPFGTIVKIYKGVKIVIVIHVGQVFNTDADWNSGTKTRTAADAGDLIIF